MLSAPAQTMSTFRALGVRMVRIIVVWAQIAPGRRLEGAHRVQRLEPVLVPPGQLGALRRDDRARPRGRTRSRPDAERRRAAVGRGPRDPGVGTRQPVLGLAPVRERVRPVRARRRPAVQRDVRAARADRPAAARELLGGLERAQLRRGPRAAGHRRLDRVGGAGDVPIARRPDVERPSGDRARPRHVPDRRVRADGPERCRGTRPSPGPPRRLQPDQAAPVRAHPVLPGLELPGVARARGPVRRVPDHGRRVAELPPAEPGAVQRHRRRRPPVLVYRLAPECRDLDRPRHRHVPADPQPRARARPGPARLRLGQALPDLQHRVRLHHPSPEPLLVPLAGDRRVLHQLGRVPELEAAAGRHDDAIPPVRPETDRRDVPWRRRLRERPGDRQRQGQARVRGIPPAAAPTGDLDPAWPLARGVGVRTAGAVRDPRWRPAADGSDPVRASRFIGHVFCDAPHGDDLRTRTTATSTCG